MKPLQTIGIHSPGDMGHSVGQRLRENGVQIAVHGRRRWRGKWYGGGNCCQFAVK
jgi:prephenate dehydrogenase